MSKIEKVHEMLSKDDADLIKLINDPVLWAEATLKDPNNPYQPLKLYDYQKKILRTQPKKSNGKMINKIKILRMGRRVGKSVTLSVELLWVAYTRANTQAIVVAPFETQVKVIFDMMERLMYDTFIKPVQYVRKPYYMKFANGSSIKGFTAGVRSSTKGDSIRGTEGDLIILDEVDSNIDDIIKEIVLPIYFNNKKSRIIMAGTPSGTRGLFYSWCQNPEKVAGIQFHLPSTVSPQWTKSMEETAKMTMTRQQYTTQILAEFGDLAEGIFKNDDIIHMLQDYDYGIKYDRKNKYIMGIDWNETYGAAIVIVEFNIGSNQFRVFRNIQVLRFQYKQLAAVEKIIELDKVFPCMSIYLDKGYGATQYELLKQYGAQHPMSNFSKKLHAIEYGGKISVRNAFGKIEQYPTKAYMVNNMVQYVESHNIFMPVIENEKDGLVDQMRNFKIIKYSAADVPVYDGGSNDHALNALFLAMLGFKIELAKHVVHSSRAVFQSDYIFPKMVQRDFSVQKHTKVEKSIRNVFPGYKPRQQKSRNIMIIKSNKMPKRRNI